MKQFRVVDRVGDERWVNLCAITDLLSKAADLHREFVISDMSLAMCGGCLFDIQRIVSKLDAAVPEGGRCECL